MKGALLFIGLAILFVGVPGKLVDIWVMVSRTPDDRARKWVKRYNKNPLAFMVLSAESNELREFRDFLSDDYTEGIDVRTVPEFQSPPREMIQKEVKTLAQLLVLSVGLIVASVFVR